MGKALRQVDLCKGNGSFKCSIPDLLQPFRQVHFFKIRMVLKGPVCQDSNTFRYRHLLQFRIVPVCFTSDRSERKRVVQFFQVDAVAKGSIGNGFDRIRQLYLCKTCTPVEGVISNIFQFFRKLRILERSAAFETVCPECFQVFREKDFFKGSTVFKNALPDRIYSRGKLYGYDPGPGKRVITDFLYGIFPNGRRYFYSGGSPCVPCDLSKGTVKGTICKILRICRCNSLLRLYLIEDGIFGFLIRILDGNSFCALFHDEVFNKSIFLILKFPILYGIILNIFICTCSICNFLVHFGCITRFHVCNTVRSSDQFCRSLFCSGSAGILLKFLSICQ